MHSAHTQGTGPATDQRELLQEYSGEEHRDGKRGKREERVIDGRREVLQLEGEGGKRTKGYSGEDRRRGYSGEERGRRKGYSGEERRVIVGGEKDYRGGEGF